MNHSPLNELVARDKRLQRALSMMKLKSIVPTLHDRPRRFFSAQKTCGDALIDYRYRN